MASTASWQRPTDFEALRLCSLLRRLSPASSSVASEAPYLRDAHRCQNQKRIIWSKLWGWDLVKILKLNFGQDFEILQHPTRTWYLILKKKTTRCAMSGGDRISNNICLGYFRARYFFKIVSPQSANMGHFWNHVLVCSCFLLEKEESYVCYMFVQNNSGISSALSFKQLLNKMALEKWWCPHTSFHKKSFSGSQLVLLFVL